MGLIITVGAVIVVEGLPKRVLASFWNVCEGEEEREKRRLTEAQRRDRAISVRKVWMKMAAAKGAGREGGERGRECW